MTDHPIKMCIFPGCDRPAAPPHALGGPRPAFCDREDHNALTAHHERLRRAGKALPGRTSSHRPARGA